MASSRRSQPEQVDGVFARRWWRALMANATALLRDAGLLLKADSPARARSLVILSLEELAKAEALASAAHEAWNGGADVVELKPGMVTLSTRHPEKLSASLVYGEQLAFFWSPSSPWSAEADVYSDTSIEFNAEFFEKRKQERKAAAELLNRAKQSGFYVDRRGDVLSSPDDGQDADAIRAELERAAGVALMHLIEDHSRMKFDSSRPYESTHDLQFALIAMGGSPIDPESSFA
jgi:AbiV family abortive infection protein